MRPIRVVPIAADGGLLQAAAPAIARELRTDCFVSADVLDPVFALHRERNQYHSTRILEELARRRVLACPGGEDVGLPIFVGITAVDLYIPILTFVFGEAHVGGTSALVSYHRLTQEFYGLPRDPAIVIERLVKETVHEVGHTAGLHHCDDYECVMAPSHAVEWVDMKRRSFCHDCAEAYASYGARREARQA